MSFAPEPLRPDARRRLERGFWGLSALFTTIGISLPMAFARADSVNFLFNIVMYGIAYIMEKILDFFGQFVIMLVDAIISVAQYNTFTTATPVEAGWPLVRDVVNMFFIVVLLVTAFSTIIQYKKFEYKKILPKLLLMAVLVNFSKTLIGILIDFSQVVMLTFVNGFKAAAAGNFTSALKLDKVLQWATSNDPANGVNPQQFTLDAQTKDPMLAKIVMAEMLGMFMLGTSLVTLLIMLIYLIARIIGLWIALIMSPLALFVTALPDGMSKGAGALTGDFWSRLNAMLVGGPIMAFFLWLTLATVQTGGFGDFTSSGAREAERTDAIQYFSNSVGNSQELATFLVGVLMLLTGLNAAVSISKAAAPELGKTYERIKNTGMRYTRFASYGALAAGGGLAARGAYRGARNTAAGVGRVAESQLNIAGRLGQGLQNYGSRIPIVGTGIAKRGADIAARRTKERAAYTKSLEAATANLAVGDRMKILEGSAGSTTLNADKKRAAQAMLAKLQVSSDGMKAMSKTFEEEGKEKNLSGSDLKAYVEQKTRGTAGKSLKGWFDESEKIGDEKSVKEIKEIYEKRPEFKMKQEDIDKMISGMMDDPDGGLKKINSRAWEDTRLLKSFAHASGMTEAIQADGTLDKDHDSVKKILEAGGARAELVRNYAMELHRTREREGVTLEAALDSRATQGMYVSAGRDATGKPVWHLTQQSVLDAAEKATPLQFNAHAATTYRRDDDVKKHIEEVKELRRTGVPETDPRIRNAQYSAMFAGGHLEEIYKMDTGKDKDGKPIESGGRFIDDRDRKSFTQNISQVIQQGSTNPEVYNQVDFSVFQKNITGQNQARSILASEANLSQLESAYTTAQTAGNASAAKQIGNAVGAIHAEGERIKQQIEGFNKTADAADKVDISKVYTAATLGSGAAPGSPAFVAAVSELRKATEKMGGMSLDEAKALLKARNIESNATLKNARTNMSERTKKTKFRGKSTDIPKPPAPPAGHPTVPPTPPPILPLP